MPLLTPDTTLRYNDAGAVWARYNGAQVWPSTTTPPEQNTVLGSDTFTRTVTSGWGTADTGGAWTATSSKTSVDGSAGVMSLNGANDAASARLPGASGVDLATEVTVSLSVRPNGGGAFGLVRSRITPAGDEYRFKYQMAATGVITAWWAKSIAGTETVISPVVTVPTTYAAGTRLRIKAPAIGAFPTNLLSKVWVEGTTEPTGWLHDLDDATTTLQEAGHVGVYTQLSSGTSGAVTVRYDDLHVEAWGAVIDEPTEEPDEPDEPIDPPPEPSGDLIRYINYDDPALSTTSYGPLVGASQTYDLADAVYVVETPRNPAPWETGTPVPPRMVVVRGADVAGSGTYKPSSAARFEVRRNDEYASVTSTGLYRTSRSEYRENHRDLHPAGEERWYRFRYLIPTGFQFGGAGGRASSLWFILTQFKTAGGSPPLDIELSGQRLRLGGTEGGARTIVNTVTPGTWGEITIGVVPHTNPAIGWVEVRHNGAVVIPKTYKVTTKTESGAPAGYYLKQGIYRTASWNSAPNDQGGTGVDHVIQLGSVKVGPTLASVTEPPPQTSTLSVDQSDYPDGWTTWQTYTWLPPGSTSSYGDLGVKGRDITNLSNTGKYNIVCPEPFYGLDNKLGINGGHSWRISGLQAEFTGCNFGPFQPGKDVETPEKQIVGNALLNQFLHINGRNIADNTDPTFRIVEGAYAKGNYFWEFITYDAKGDKGPDSTLLIQNARVDGMNWVLTDTGGHEGSDVLQPYRGPGRTIVRGLTVKKLTYQGFMLQMASGFDPANVRLLDLSRIDFEGSRTHGHGMMIFDTADTPSRVTQIGTKGTTAGVYFDPNPADAGKQDDAVSATIYNQITWGPSPFGENVPANLAGLSYPHK